MWRPLRVHFVSEPSKPGAPLLAHSAPAGSISAFMCWAFPRRPGGGGSGDDDARRSLMHAAYGGCAVVRAASARAFAERRRSMLAGDIIPHLHGAFEELFPDA